MSGYQWLCCIPLVVGVSWWIYLAIFKPDEFKRRAKTDPAEMRRNAGRIGKAAKTGINAARQWLDR
jgi:hypothetical protein